MAEALVDTDAANSQGVLQVDAVQLQNVHVASGLLVNNNLTAFHGDTILTTPRQLPPIGILPSDDEDDEDEEGQKVLPLAQLAGFIKKLSRFDVQVLAEAEKTKLVYLLSYKHRDEDGPGTSQAGTSATSTAVHHTFIDRLVSANVPVDGKKLILTSAKECDAGGKVKVALMKSMGKQSNFIAGNGRFIDIDIHFPSKVRL